MHNNVVEVDLPVKAVVNITLTGFDSVIVISQCKGDLHSVFNNSNDDKNANVYRVAPKKQATTNRQ